MVRHYVGLVTLLVWYLIVPPAGPTIPSMPGAGTMVQPTAPLRQWWHIQSFDGEADCLSRQKQLQTNPPPPSASTSPEARSLIHDQMNNSMCISGDDPLLK